MQFSKKRLSPLPRQLDLLSGTVPFCRNIALKLPEEVIYLPHDFLTRSFAALNFEIAFQIEIDDESSADSATVIRLVIASADEDPLPDPQGYTLVLCEPDGNVIRSRDARGIFYGLQTLLQILRFHIFRDGVDDECDFVQIPSLRIVDSPSFEMRGVMLDISRDKIPTMETLFRFVDVLAHLKYNELQLYMEHSFAYSGHEEVWNSASPVTASEMRELWKYCAQRFIRLTPNQNTLGHMHRWLRVPSYRHLAERPGSFEGRDLVCDAIYSHTGQAGFSLCPTDPKVHELVTSMFDQLLPCCRKDPDSDEGDTDDIPTPYPSAVHIGLDETDVGGRGGRSSGSSVGRLHLDYLKLVSSHVKENHGIQEVQIWFDPVAHFPTVQENFPPAVVPVIWGYEGQSYFPNMCPWIKKLGDFYVCPSTCTWNTFGGRSKNSFVNLKSAAVHGSAHGAKGYLVSHWGDNGHLQPLALSYFPLVLGSAFSWDAETARRTSIQTLRSFEICLSHHVFLDRAGVMGSIAASLGDAHRRFKGSERAFGGCSELFCTLIFNGDAPRAGILSNVTEETIRITEELVQRERTRLQRVHMARTDSDLIIRQYLLRTRLQLFTCRVARALLSAKSVPEIEVSERRLLGSELIAIMDEYKSEWVLENRPGGLSDSLRRIQHFMGLLLSS